MNRTMCAWTVIGAAFLAGPGRAEDPPTLEQALVRQAPRIIKHCKENGYANVGVLKFLVTKDDKSFSDNVGALNMSLAQRLEVALVLENDPRAPLGIIRNASAVAARISGANHLSREGRPKLFGATYPLAWGTENVTPDAFITGTASVSPDLKTLTVGLLFFDRKKNDLTPLGDDLVVANKPAALSEIGESFTVRGIFDGGRANPAPAETAKREKQALESAAQVKRKDAVNPLTDPVAPIKLEICYDGVPMPIRFTNGRAEVAEPREGQKVTLVLGRNNTKVRLGVVLKVNGENTLERQTLSDGRCRMWILDPGKGPHEIVGFQEKNNEKARAFRVMSVAESRKSEVNYGADVGTVTVTVFRELQGQPPPPGLSDEAQDSAAVQRSRLPAAPPKNYHALRAQLLADANRGLIGVGEQIDSQVRIVDFTPDPTPVMSATVFYYKR